MVNLLKTQDPFQCEYSYKWDIKWHIRIPDAHAGHKVWRGNRSHEWAWSLKKFWIKQKINPLKYTWLTSPDSPLFNCTKIIITCTHGPGDPLETWLFFGTQSKSCVHVGDTPPNDSKLRSVSLQNPQMTSLMWVYAEYLSLMLWKTGFL